MAGEEGRGVVPFLPTLYFFPVVSWSWAGGGGWGGGGVDAFGDRR